MPAVVLLFEVNIKLAGSPSLAVTLSTMLVSFAGYSKDSSFAPDARGNLLIYAVKV
jgi:uncharacterized protein